MQTTITSDHRRLGDWALEARISAEDRARRQASVFHQTLQLSTTLDGPNFRKIALADLQRMSLLIDEFFFDGRLLPLARREGLRFKLSQRMTKTAGRTTMFHAANGQRRHYEVTLSTTLLFQTFLDVHRPIAVTGLICHSRLEAMQRVVEHELLHLLELMVWNQSACHLPQFQKMAGGLFGHRSHQHELITQTERAADRYGVRLGARVAFHVDGQRIIGIVNRITRRATVLVPDPAGEPFSDGRRYRRYYVPLAALRPA
jgi:hypothetical protein